MAQFEEGEAGHSSALSGVWRILPVTLRKCLTPGSFHYQKQKERNLKKIKKKKKKRRRKLSYYF